MTTFHVWAPLAQRVDVEVGGARLPLTAGEGGWWSVDVPAAGREQLCLQSGWWLSDSIREILGVKKR